MRPSRGVYPETPPIRNSDFTGGMVELSEKEMEQISAGATLQCTAWRTICVVTGVGSFLGLVGALICGPTALACILDTAIDFSGC